MNANRVPPTSPKGKEINKKEINFTEFSELNDRSNGSHDIEAQRLKTDNPLTKAIAQLEKSGAEGKGDSPNPSADSVDSRLCMATNDNPVFPLPYLSDTARRDNKFAVATLLSLLAVSDRAQCPSADTKEESADTLKPALVRGPSNIGASHKKMSIRGSPHDHEMAVFATGSVKTNPESNNKNPMFYRADVF
eukprot:gene6670-2601_t